MKEQKSMEDKSVSPVTNTPRYQAPINGPYEYTAPVPRKPFTSSTGELVMALCSFPLAYFYIRYYIPAIFRISPMIFQRDILLWNGGLYFWGMVIFPLLFLVWTEAFCQVEHCEKAPKEHLFWAGCLVVIALSQKLWFGTVMQGWDTLILHFVAAYWVIVRTGCLADRRTGPMFLLDALNAMVLQPFGQFFLRLRVVCNAIGKLAKNKENNRHIGIALLSILLILPLLMFVAIQLGQADPTFAAILDDLYFELAVFLGKLFLKIEFWFSLPVGAYLYGLVGGSLRAKGEPSLRKVTDGIRSNADKARFAPSYALMVSVVAFCLLYLVFFGVQVGYLTGRLHRDMSTAEFARSGFWQLCRVVMLNFMLMLAVCRLGKTTVEKSRLLKAQMLSLDVCNLLFAIVAIAKMVEYVKLYGLTPLRVLASWFMLVLVCFVVLAAVVVFKPIPAARIGILLAATLFTLLCICNPDKGLIRVNLWLYEKGITQELDTHMLRSCGAKEDIENYRRLLYQSGWLVGRTEREVQNELGKGDFYRNHSIYWQVGKDDSKPAMLIVTFDGLPSQENSKVIKAEIIKGMQSPNEQLALVGLSHGGCVQLR